MGGRVAAPRRRAPAASSIDCFKSRLRIAAESCCTYSRWLQICVESRCRQSIENRLHYDMCHAVSRPGCIPAFSNSSFPHKSPAQHGLNTPRKEQSQEPNVSKRNSRMLWQLGEIRAQEPFLPPIVGSFNNFLSGSATDV